MKHFYGLFQCIYPLCVFLLVAFDKIRHSREPQIPRDNDWPKERSAAVTVTFEIDVERSAALGAALDSPPAHAIPAVPAGEAKPTTSESA